MSKLRPTEVEGIAPKSERERVCVSTLVNTLAITIIPEEVL
jgi:hypothetical protein